ncbi:hypothetical protein KL86DYS1_30392 [uncultured Dysgonomonas sp.]|uniref:Uncharacterized protein n=1 Tax=uncultured Dysgonomonas sp. TaxID=206096 RepID=A0A212JTI0_9BACT|nr:hypothetical protein KL86DYS1_30392 [uncultured Dysgonomonas sp.]
MDSFLAPPIVGSPWLKISRKDSKTQKGNSSPKSNKGYTFSTYY